MYALYHHCNDKDNYHVNDDNDIVVDDDDDDDEINIDKDWFYLRHVCLS